MMMKTMFGGGVPEGVAEGVTREVGVGDGVIPPGVSVGAATVAVGDGAGPPPLSSPQPAATRVAARRQQASVRAVVVSCLWFDIIRPLSSSFCRFGFAPST
jgi:hypothetical protein